MTYFVFIAVGIYCIVCSVNDYDWFMDAERHFKLRLFYRSPYNNIITLLFGRRISRIFWICFGVALIAIGIFGLIIP